MNKSLHFVKLLKKVIDLGLTKEVKGNYIIPKGTKVLDYGADMSGYYFHIDNEHVKDYERTNSKNIKKTDYCIRSECLIHLLLEMLHRFCLLCCYL